MSTPRREEVLELPREKRGLPPIITPREREGLREVGRVAGEVVRKIATGLEETARRIEKIDVPRLTRNALVLATGGMTIYLMVSAVSAMYPYAVQVYAQFGTVLGYIIPLMFMTTVFAIMMALIKHLVK
jgi:hypothetical protein